MNGVTRVGAYALGLVVVFGGALGAGRVAGPVASPAEAARGSGQSAARSAAPGGHAGGQAGHGGEQGGQAGGHGAGQDTGHGAAPSTTPGTGSGTRSGTAAQAVKAPVVPGGLQVSEGGYTLLPETDELKAGERTDFRFSVIGPDGHPVTDFAVQHDKELHFIVVRRDLTGFQHLHPVRKGDGVWSVPLELPAAGEYRAFADFAPEGGKAMTLGMDLSVAGDYRPAPPAAPSETAKVGDYTVTLTGGLVAGRTSMLTLSVAKDGRPVTDLEPYLAAYGHLVALRDGDLAYLHVHPDGAPGDGRTKAGPAITFYAEVPSSGTYRLFLDFQHAGTVRTAAFTAVTAPDPESAGATKPAEDDHGSHEHGDQP